jgi:hypothetical protein
VFNNLSLTDALLHVSSIFPNESSILRSDIFHETCFFLCRQVILKMSCHVVLFNRNANVIDVQVL